MKLYADANGLSYKYYQPANGSEATDDDRYNAMKAAADAGAEVIVCAGYLQEAALKRAAMEYPNIPFVFIDGYPISDDNGNVLTNVAGISFKEEQAGYFAATPLSRTASRSWASPAAAAAPTMPAAGSATASSRAPTRLPLRWTRPWTSTTPGSTAHLPGLR